MIITQNGYYLSSYVHIDKLANVYNLEIRHDQNIALWKYNNGKLKIIHYWELERLTGYKHHAVSFYDRNDYIDFVNVLLDKYALKYDDIIEEWSGPKTHVICKEWYNNIAYHNLAHVFTALMKNTDCFHKKNILILAVDGGPDSVNLKKNDIHFSSVYSSYGEIVAMKSINSPAPLWSWTKLLFDMEEGSLMALMSASESRVYRSNFFDIPRITDADSAYKAYEFVINICDYVWGLNKEDAGTAFNFYDERFSVHDNRISMVMKVIYDISCRMMCQNIDFMIEEYTIKPTDTILSVVGGYGLNCPSNSFLLSKYGFESFIEIPCINDSGISLGIGLLECYMMNTEFQFEMKTSYYGDWIEGADIDRIKEAKYISSIKQISLEQFTQDVCANPIIWIDGRGEIGPRALGHRSLISTPEISSKSILNRIKRRQWWRPVAPIILEEYVSEWFLEGTESKCMLKTFQVMPIKKQLVEAICHLDGSARVQTISNSDGNLLYELLKGYYDKTGIPILCNTSLNDKGEPIIQTIERAIEFASEKHIKVIYVNGYRLELNLSEKLNFSEDNSLKDFFSLNKDRDLLKEINPYNLNKNELYFYYNSAALHKLGLDNEKNTKIIKRLYHNKIGHYLKEIIAEEKYHV